MILWIEEDVIVSCYYGVQIPDRPNLTQRCTRFATASTFTQVALLPWRHDAKMGTATLCTLRRNTASITKGLVFWKKILIIAQF